MTTITSARDEEHPMAEVQEEQASKQTTEPAVEEDLLVEEVSIDGMCGVY